MDQDETRHRGRPRPRSHCVRRGPSSPSPKGAQPPIFGPCVFWQYGWMDQDTTWYRGRPLPNRHCVRWGPSSLAPKKCGTALPTLRTMSVVAKQLDGSQCHLIERYCRPRPMRHCTQHPIIVIAILPTFETFVILYTTPITSFSCRHSSSRVSMLYIMLHTKLHCSTRSS